MWRFRPSRSGAWPRATDFPVQLCIRFGPDWTVIISDDGCTREQLTVFSSFEDQARARYTKLPRLTRHFKLDCSSSELRYVASDLGDTLRRVLAMVRVMVAALDMIAASWW